MSSSFDISDNAKGFFAPFFRSFFSRFSLDKMASKAFFYLLGAPLLALLSLGVAFSASGPMVTILPYMALMGFVVTALLRTPGLALAYLFLVGWVGCSFYSDTPTAWELTLVLSLAIQYYIALLSLEEVESLLAKVTLEVREKTKEIHLLHASYKTKEEESDKRRQELQEELEKWKEEAEARHLEKRALEEKLALVDGELKHFHSQKEAFVAEARAARKERAIGKEREEEVLKLLEEKEEEVRKERALRETLPLSNTTSLPAQEDPALKNALARAEGMYKQLREQFEEKCRTLDEVRKGAFEKETALLAFEQEKEGQKGAPTIEEMVTLEEDLAQLLYEREALEEEIVNLEGLISHILHQ